ncbi:MAG: 3-oxoacid CoA-transferase subunit B [Spirochaetales bacterium]|uniref:3-oxoacid CoA-transferase subunit B n=1 Tax=Candidatus Thalassospirochaeta sargassi TaxID=3119039 RepID=A0AAJ1IDX6_9SPIO|nr:3-oxoacid CoA-transferase subunit B [Spirochaetales bacterium]
MDYTPRKDVIAKRIARLFSNGNVVNLGIGLPTQVGNYVPEGVDIILQSENGFMGLGPAPEKGKEDPFLVNAGGAPVTLLSGGCYFDSATSFGIIRGGHVDYTVLGVLEVDQHGNLANYKIPGKMVPGMGGAMDLTVGSKKVIAATVHFDKKGNSKLMEKCTLPLTALNEVDILVTDVGYFEIKDGAFVLKETFAPYTAEFVQESTTANLVIAPDYKQVVII